ncbi:MAG TPA: DNA repair exonuclease [Desulfobulbaceae bacterium]|nr:DNA repair exonuclease [Desulfobulbaceae bacterium]
MVTFLHTADIHLDSPLKGLEAHDGAPVAEIRGATRRAFDNLIELAIEEKVDFLLIAGDLYDGDWKDYNTGLFFAARMGRLLRAGIRVFIVSGNHDAASQITRYLPLPENVTLFAAKKPQSVRLDDLGVVIHGQSYSTRTVTENLAAGYPPAVAGCVNIGLLHTSLTGRAGHEEYAPCTVDDLRAKGYDYWALGHVHQREIVAEDPWIVFPGNVQGRHIRENGVKGATLVTVVDGCIARVAFRELDVLRWDLCRVDLTGCATGESVHDAVRLGLMRGLDQAGGRTLAVRLVLTGKCPVHNRLMERIAEWTEEFRGIAAGQGEVWLEKVVFQTGRAGNAAEMPDDDTPIAGLLQAIAGLDLDGESLLGMVPELAVLKSKLPPELHVGKEAPLDPTAAGTADLRSAVQELLIAKLLNHGGHKCA